MSLSNVVFSGAGSETVCSLNSIESMVAALSSRSFFLVSAPFLPAAATIDSMPLREHTFSEPVPEKTLSSTLDKDIWENPKVLLALGAGWVVAVAYLLYSKVSLLHETVENPACIETQIWKSY